MIMLSSKLHPPLSAATPLRKPYHTTCLFIIKGICKKKNMKITLNIAINAAVRQRNVAERFKVNGEYTFFQITTSDYVKRTKRPLRLGKIVRHITVKRIFLALDLLKIR